MVSLTDVQASNSRISTALPSGLVAVFVGATGGIGEFTLRQFAKNAKKPRVYFVGRTQEAGDRIAAECKSLNPEGEFIYIKADTSLIRNVDDVCRDISSKESTINLLFLTTGTLNFQAETTEDLRLFTALALYSRSRFILNLLPLLQRATSLRRVVSVFAATKEGRVFTDDFQCRKVSMMSGRGHASSVATFSLEALAKMAPDVSFVHNFPGPVKTNIGRTSKGLVMSIMGVFFKIIGPFVYIPSEETGERHLFLATSARFPSGSTNSEEGTTTSGVPLEGGVKVAKGSNGENGSGVYSIDAYGESAPVNVLQLMARLRSEGVVDKVWKDHEDQFRRITGGDSSL